jgi:myosin heavy subunit
MAKGKGDATLGKLSKSLGLINSELQTIQRGIQLMREAGKSAKQIYTQYGKQLEKLIQDEADLNKQIEERKELVKNESDTLAKYNTLQRKSTKERKDALKQLSDIELKEYKKSENVKNSGLKADKRRKLAALKANDKLELQKIRSSKLSTNKRLEAELSVLNRIQRRYKKSSKEYKEAEIAKVKAQENALNARDKNIKKYRDSRPDTKEKTSFLGGVRQGLEGGAIGKAVGRLGGVGAAIAVLRKSFQALSKAVTGSFKAAVDFEAQLAQLQAVTGINNQELSRLEKNVLDVAGSTKFTSEEIVQLQTELGKLGFSVSEIESATVAVARTAQALGEQVGPVAQRIGQILNQFNLDAAETTRVADSLVSVINSSALSFEGFSTALQYIGPLGAEVGTTFEETSVAMALLADNGFTASRIGTGLRGILTELSTTG